MSSSTITSQVESKGENEAVVDGAHPDDAPPKRDSEKVLCICALGSRGDCQPLAVIGVEMKKRGWRVIVCSEERTRPLAVQFGLEFRLIAGDLVGLIFEEKYTAMLAKGSIMPIMKAQGERKAKTQAQVLLDWKRTVSDADFILSGALCMTETFSLAEYLRIPWRPCIFGPTYPTREFPLFFIMEKNWWGRLNAWTYWGIFYAMWAQEKGVINAWRKEALNLPPLTQTYGMMGVIDEFRIPTVGAFSNLLLPTPDHARPADWQPHYTMTGFCFPPATPDQQVDGKLVAFVAAGVKDNNMEENKKKNKCLVYLGFGSMPCPEPRLLIQVATQIVTELGVRAIVCAGWSGLAVTDDLVSPALKQDLFITASAPHDWLFPRCQAIVHHCGIGTCAATLLAGTPSVPCPVMLDQPHNAHHLFATLQVACKPLPFADLLKTPALLIDRLRSLLADEEMAARAVRVSTLVKGAQSRGDGAQRAVEECLLVKSECEWEQTCKEDAVDK